MIDLFSKAYNDFNAQRKVLQKSFGRRRGRDRRMSSSENFEFVSYDFAAGLGFEPRYQLPESCVLPLDDPAMFKFPDIF